MLKALLRRFSLASLGNVLRVRALDPRTRRAPFFLFEGRTFSYRETFEESVCYAKLFERTRQRCIAEGRLERGAALGIGVYQENTPEFVFALFGAAMSNDVLFGLNTGFRGETLGAILARSGARLLLTQEKLVPELDAVLPKVPDLRTSDVLLVDAAETAERSLGGALRAAESTPRPARRIDIGAPVIIIYTSGTTGLPKGVPCSQMKLLGSGILTRFRIKLRRDDRGYVCMPLFHSNSWFLGIMPILSAGGSFVLRRKFSASGFEEDLLRDGFSYMNYVGQPIHYILAALERKHGGLDAAEAALARDPRNRFRIAHGNGALPKDRVRLVRCLGMEHIYELYGSTEAPISTVVKPGDPPDSVGEVKSKKILVVNERDLPCPPGRVDGQGRLLNYEEAVGEIVREMDEDNLFFDGYHQNPDASARKFRNGYFRSGDLGHIQVIGRKRYLYFDGRTDDWIRKDGENFSAENVAYYASHQPGIALAVAYGVPSEVADEKVMVAVQLEPGKAFEIQATHDYFREKERSGGMDPKWMPDFIRVVSAFEMTPTEKVLVRPLKRLHFRPDPAAPVYFRERGDETYRPFGDSEYAVLRQRFAENGRTELLDR